MIARVRPSHKVSGGPDIKVSPGIRKRPTGDIDSKVDREFAQGASLRPSLVELLGAAKLWEGL